MAMTPIPVPAFPNVPFANGVPPLLRAGGVNSALRVVLLFKDALSILNMFLPSQWGIFTQGGQSIVTADSVVKVQVTRELNIPTYPQERGAFVSYNKVQIPFDVRVRFVVSSSQQARAAFLQAIDNAALSLDLYNVVTPDATYYNVNIVHYDYVREQRIGTSTLSVDVWLQYVRLSVVTTFTQTKTPAGAAPVNAGNIQQSPVPGGAPT